MPKASHETNTYYQTLYEINILHASFTDIGHEIILPICDFHIDPFQEVEDQSIFSELKLTRNNGKIFEEFSDPKDNWFEDFN